MVQVDLLASGIETRHFYGLGNETQAPEDPKDVRAIRQVVHPAPAFAFMLSPYWRFQAGMSFEFSKTEDDRDTLLGEIDPRGAGESWQGGFTAHFELDALDSHAWPSRGVYFKLGGEYFPALADKVSGEVGLCGFVDTGRVFFAGESSNKWHTGYGGGIWLAPLLRQLTLGLAVAGSDEGTRIYCSFGMGY